MTSLDSQRPTKNTPPLAAPLAQIAQVISQHIVTGIVRDLVIRREIHLKVVAGGRAERLSTAPGAKGDRPG
jgi:hypothetical protein